MPPDPPTKGARHLKIGKYQVVAHIATGGMGAVYRATDLETGRDVALKILSPEIAAKPGVVERFRREAAHAAKLRHENIVRLYDWGEVNNIYYLAFEFFEGTDLQAYVTRKGKLRPDVARHIMLQAAAALGHVHKQNIVHRDIKPSNFLLRKRQGKPYVKLIDLGLAREVDNEEFRITRANHTLGTIDYMSPEQARDSGLADARSDIYSLGCTFYHLLTGHPPFPEGGLAERLHKHTHEVPPDVSDFNPDVPPGTVQIIRRMLEKDPAARYQSVDDLIDDLKNPESVRAPIKTEFLAELAREESVPASDDALPPPRKSNPPTKLPLKPSSDPAMRERKTPRPGSDPVLGERPQNRPPSDPLVGDRPGRRKSDPSRRATPISIRHPHEDTKEEIEVGDDSSDDSSVDGEVRPARAQDATTYWWLWAAAVAALIVLLILLIVLVSMQRSSTPQAAEPLTGAMPAPASGPLPVALARVPSEATDGETIEIADHSPLFEGPATQPDPPTP